MVDLDSNPTKLIEIVEIGKQLLMTRGALTTFSIANDVAKYFAIIPAAFAGTYPALERAQRHAARDAGERDPVGGDLQRAHHRRADPAGAARRALPPGRRAARCCASNLLDLRPRRPRRAVRRHQADRPGAGRAAAWPEEIDHAQAAPPALVVLLVAHACSPASSIRSLVTGVAQLLFPRQANGSLIERDGKVVGSALIGQPFDDPRYFWGRPLGDRRRCRTTRAASSGSNLGPAERRAGRGGAGRASTALRAADPGNAQPVPGRPGHRLRQRARPAHQPGGGRVPGGARRAGARADRRRACARWSPSTPRAGSFGLLGEPASTCSTLNLRAGRLCADGSHERAYAC